MTDRAAAIFLQPSVIQAEFFGRADAAYARAFQHQPVLNPDDTSALAPAATKLATRAATGGTPLPANTTRPAALRIQTNGFDWFEHPHVIARSYAFGNILTAQNVSLVVFNAYRRTRLAWSAFANGAGAGVNLLGQPSLPYVIPPLEQVSMTLQVLTSGNPAVNATLDFTFGDGSFIDIPITLTRVVLIPHIPEGSYEEVLEFLTNVHVHTDETEQRNSPRKNPRQSFAFEYLVQEGAELQRFDNAMFDWHPRLFGVPVWHDQMFLTGAVSIGATTIQVDSTANIDLRVGGLCMLRSSEATFDVLEVASFTSTSITFVAPTVNAYAIVGTTVAPVRLGRILGRSVRGSRRPKGMALRRVQFEVQDNNISIASTAAFPSLNSKVLLTDGNVIAGVLSEALDREVIVLDNDTGAVSQYSMSDRDRRVSTKTFFTAGRLQRWQARQLMHALQGRRVSFYLPTFYEDMTLFSDLISGTNGMEIVNTGYARFVRVRSPWTIIRLVFNNGSAPLIRNILTAVETSSAKDTLTVDVNWPSAIPKSTVSRIEFIEKVRWDSDSIRIIHEPGFRVSKFTAPVRAVLE